MYMPKFFIFRHLVMKSTIGVDFFRARFYTLGISKTPSNTESYFPRKRISAQYRRGPNS